MKKTLLFLFTVSLFGCKQEKELKLVWSDEFNYHGLPDSSKWTAKITAMAVVITSSNIILQQDWKMPE